MIWMMHGMPTWSYLYRKIIPPLVNAGYRCFIPDLMGFGLSDKPAEESAHTLQRHVALMTRLIDKLGLRVFLRRFVGEAKSHQIGYKTAIACVHKRWNDFPVQVAPCRHAMHHPDHRTFSFVEIVQAHAIYGGVAIGEWIFETFGQGYLPDTRKSSMSGIGR